MTWCLAAASPAKHSHVDPSLLIEVLGVQGDLLDPVVLTRPDVQRAADESAIWGGGPAVALQLRFVGGLVGRRERAAGRCFDDSRRLLRGEARAVVRVGGWVRVQRNATPSLIAVQVGSAWPSKLVPRGMLASTDSGVAFENAPEASATLGAATATVAATSTAVRVRRRSVRRRRLLERRRAAGLRPGGPGPSQRASTTARRTSAA
jgi:hypothetical protein